MRCLHALGEWEQLQQLFDKTWTTVDETTQYVVAPYATAAAWYINVFVLLGFFLFFLFHMLFHLLADLFGICMRICVTYVFFLSPSCSFFPHTLQEREQLGEDGHICKRDP